MVEYLLQRTVSSNAAGKRLSWTSFDRCQASAVVVLIDLCHFISSEMKSKRTIGNWPLKNAPLCCWLLAGAAAGAGAGAVAGKSNRKISVSGTASSMYYIVVAENMSTSPTRPKTAAKAIDKRAE